MNAVEKNLRKALRRSNAALDDWVRSYAPDFVKQEHLDETLERIREGGGTLAYIADVKEGNQEALDAHNE